MWSRKVIKQKAWGRLKYNYWRMVLVALVIGIVGTGSATVSRTARVRDLKHSVQELREDWDYDEDDYDYWEDDTDWEDTDWEDEDDADDWDESAIAMPEVQTISYQAEPVSYQYGENGLYTTARILGGIFFAILGVVLAGGILINVFLINPLRVGGNRFFIKNIQEEAKVSNLGYSFDSHYMNIVKIMFFYDLYQLLWTLLLVIPGIVKAYEYRMIPYLLAENPEMSKQEAFETSKRMMDGNKWDVFVLDLSFIGWNLLGAITFGLLDIFLVNPYFEQTCAMLYDALKFDDAKKEIAADADWEFPTDGEVKTNDFGDEFHWKE